MARIRSRWLKWGSGWVVLLLFIHLGSCHNLELEFEQPEQGFFLKPLYLKPEDIYPPKVNRALAITNPLGPINLRVEYGPFVDKKTATPALIHSAVANASFLYQSVSIEGRDLSAHLISHSLIKSNPRLQVLFHSSQNQQIAKRNNTIMDTVHNSIWCLRVHVIHSRDEVNSICELRDGLGVCLVNVSVPLQWWEESSHIAIVSYTAFTVDQNHHCSDAVNSIVPGKSHSRVQFESKIGPVTLLTGASGLQELREDHNVLIYMPQRSFYPGSRFSVPVRLQAESDLEFLVMRVRTRSGIRVLGAKASNPNHWEVKPNVKPHNMAAFVVAFVLDKEKYSKTSKVQDVFEWLFEVDNGPETYETGKIIFSLDYDLRQNLRESNYQGRNRVVTQVHIQRDDVEAIVPVVKSTELVNTAMLTGKFQSYTMHVYAVTEAGKIREVTSQATCHSGDTAVLKVALACNLVYLDGTETKGSSSVSIITKFGRHTKFLFFRVWAPEFPLDIELSDDKLGQIKAWKTKKHQMGRHGRDADPPLLTHPELVHPLPRVHHEDYQTACHLRYQQALLDVYARFHVKDGSSKAYMVHRKAYMKITHLVIDKLRIADMTIASLSGRVIQGLQPGRTEVQVLSKTGRVVSAKEVRVVKDKVGIEGLVVNVVSGVSLNLSTGSDLLGTLVATAAVDPVLHKKYQEAFLDVNVNFTDGTRLPLRQVAPDDYYLNLDTLNNHVVGFRIMSSPDRPRVIALGQGKGELVKLSLELGDDCQRRKSRPLAVSYVYVNVDFSKNVKEETHILRDVPTDKEDNSTLDVDEYSDKGNFEYKKDTEIDKNGEKEPGKDNVDEAIPVLSKQQMSPNQGGFLKTGIYVLLGVFSLAAVLIFIICGALVYRYQHKRVPKHKAEPVAQVNDWVWLGPATLERNSINTDCSQALMSEEDFNGNQISHTRSDTSSASTSNRNSMHSSNRNSVVSTYRGSECSIRITSNPLPEFTPRPNSTPKSTDGTRPKEYDWEAMGMTHEEMVTYFENLKESTA